MSKSIFLSWFAIFFFFALHLGIFHWIKIKHRTRVVLLLFFFTTVIYFGLQCASLPEFLTDFFQNCDDALIQSQTGLPVLFSLSGFFFFSLIFLIYLEFYFTCDRSITIRIMREIHQSKFKRMKIEEFKLLYETDYQIFERRFKEMAAYGYLKKDSGGYELTALGKLVAIVSESVIRFIHLDGG